MIKHFLIIITIFFFISCEDLFTTRTPESPQITNPNNQATTVNNLVQNFKNSIYNEDVEQYSNLFINEFVTTDFTYRFKTNDSTIDTTIFTGWGIENERKFSSSFFEDNRVTSFHIDPSNFEEVSGDTTLIEFEYSGNLKNLNGEEINIKGKSKFTLKKIGNLWYLYYWEDDRSLDKYSFTFSKLKEPFAFNN
ncbi:MAG: hypothetical protein CR982_08045 [Candidatus Cloacimonadota bacterium]|nr:MAG: hypothetical protein CR982_08045 [Candidatus Cloacimonadota bacterium]PIE77630.1 MAG: hypothetical protein CSA15_11945 [Candidatus Delongbacteria bacterium]